MRKWPRCEWAGQEQIMGICPLGLRSAGFPWPAGPAPVPLRITHSPLPHVQGSLPPAHGSDFCFPPSSSKLKTTSRDPLYEPFIHSTHSSVGPIACQAQVIGIHC